MVRFRGLRDPLFLSACAVYALNRWLMKPMLGGAFLSGRFNDILLIPCALPPVLWLHQQLGLRRAQGPPTAAEVASHLVGWSILFEWIGPWLVPHTVRDPLDVVAYAAGALAGWAWWNRKSWGAVSRNSTG